MCVYSLSLWAVVRHTAEAQADWDVIHGAQVVRYAPASASTDARSLETGLGEWEREKKEGGGLEEEVCWCVCE